MKISSNLQKLINRLRFYINPVQGFLNKHHDTIFLFLLPIIALVFARLFLKLFLQLSVYHFFWTILYYTVFLVALYAYLSFKNKTEWVNKHVTFLAFIGILIPIILFFWQDIATESRQRLNYEIAIKEENNRNYSHLQSIATDLRQDPNTTFWRDFSIKSYTEFWSYIHLNKSQECKNLYANLTIQLGILNNINRMRQQLILLPNNLFKQMLEAASSTIPIMDAIIVKCQFL